MRFINTWKYPATGQFVYLSDQPLQVFKKYMQEGPDSREAGGILLGYVRGKHLEIIEATEPSILDRRFRFLFERMPHSHHRLAMKRWRESNGLIRYVGEWHTHPQNYPIPSSIDLREWQKLAVDRRDGRPLLALIVGCQGIHLEYMFNTGERQLLADACDDVAEVSGV
ncbi:hypothetical protein A9K79_15710 [Pseudomonas syringae pv. syringae]|jgi:integrative and conjugative element protein (TIGR02256 family)|uniref:Mov34/MPN/PAD-1 family protein n=1 Tax=Pseudomonas TaxID=286 RepID=UPI00054C23BC|nr:MULTISPECIES: Mov34/MPN/PAD-1 family protein [Pseudomonas]KII31765.1 hypothetical protein RY26_21505 [Pseudomonas fluorescens]OBS38615.1 hypothetical protein A9K79_15710 [Pseudomonas syringae pv. syringae]POP74518.1 hypothetical protein CXB37_19200 [Pseudomonas syringae pv. syringae]